MTPDLIVTLGDFEFGRLEVPESINWGGSQMLVKKRLVGGARVVDAMGADESPIGWSGLFLGENALDRAKYLNGLRIAGNPLILSWHEMYYSVIIDSFEANFDRFYKIPYRITLMVIDDLTTPVTVIADNGIDYLIGDDMATANVYGGIFGDDELSGLLGTLDAAIAQVSDFAKATQAVINSVLIPLAAVQKRVQVLIGSAANVIGNVTTLGGVLPNNPIAQSARNLTSQVTSMTQSAQLYDLQNVLGRMNGNIGTLGSTSQTLPTAGGNLFNIAAEYYGDATQWTGLAKANNISDPMIQGLKNIKIPTNPDNADGILNT